MQNDEEAIRKFVDTWLTASQAGDLATVLSLMADDIVFMVPGKEPFGKDEFVAGSEKMKDFKMEVQSDIKEIEILGEWAWMRNSLKLTFTPPGGSQTVKSGYTLTILQKGPNGNWVIKRDANLMT
jgi:uncharacterized protein (TIGR02246 family)